MLFLDIKENSNITIITRNNIFSKKILNFLFKIHFSNKINRIIEIPFKKLWYKKIIKKVFGNEDLCFVFSPSWYYPNYIKYLKKKYKNAKFIMYFSDTIESKLKSIYTLNIEKVKNEFDIVLSYNLSDVKKYNLKYTSIYYSRISSKKEKILSSKYPKVDIIFIGAERNRLEIIEKLYKKFKELNLECYFYVVTKNKVKLKEKNGIIFSNKIMDYEEYLGRMLSANYILEVIDPNTIGCTLRFWDAIMYNKKLISNYKYLKESKFYSKEKMLYYNDIKDIDNNFFKDKSSINYNYKNENSPINFLNRIKEVLEEKK